MTAPAAELARHGPRASAAGGPIPLYYILAASHSGSTLLAMLLGAHPEVCTVGELKATNLSDPERYRCSCGELIRRCPFWRRVSDAMARRGLAFDITAAGTDVRSGASPYVARLLRPLHRGPLLEAARDAALSLSPAWRARLPRVQHVNAELLACLRELTGKRAIVDSSKIGIRLKYLLRNPAVDVKVIRLVRDGRGVAIAYVDPARYADAKDPRLRGGGMGGDRASERLSVREAAREWRRSNEEAEAILARIPESRRIEVRYEALCAQPDDTLAGLFGFMGLPPAPVRQFRSMEHHVVGNGMRLDTTQEIRLDESWRSAFTPADLAVFDSMAGDMNRRYGYR